MGRHGPGLTMLVVDVDDGDVGGPAAPAPGSPASRAARTVGSWLRVHPGPGRVAGVGVVAATVAAVLLVPGWVSSAERRHVLAEPALAGAVMDVGAPLRVRWSAAADDRVGPVAVGDSVVVTAGQGDARELRGLDVVTGEQRWAVPLADPGRTGLTRCAAVGSSVACSVAPPSTGRTGVERQTTSELVLVERSGQVAGRYRVAGRVADVAAVGPVEAAERDERDERAERQVADAQAQSGGHDLLLVVIGVDRVRLDRVDARTGALRWSVPAFTRSGRATGAASVEASGPVAIVRGLGTQRVFDVATGERVHAPHVPRRADVVRLLDDGSLAWVSYDMRPTAPAVVTVLADPGATSGLTVTGTPARPVATAVPTTTFVTTRVLGVPLSGQVLAFDERRTLLWRAPVSAAEVLLASDEVVVVRDGWTYVGLDPATGVVRWAADVDRAADRVLTDGEELLLVEDGRRWGAVVTAVGADDGRVRWSARLPSEVERVVQVGSLLYGVDGATLSALR